MGKYKCLDTYKYEKGEYTLITLREQDIYKIKDWRNAQIDILRQKELLTDETQKKYFDEVIKPSFLEKNPKQILFSYLYKNKCIGYGGFVHISWMDKRAEISFLVDNNRAENEKIYQQDFLNYMELIKEIAFLYIGFNRIFTETYDFRKKHIESLELSGFIPEGRIKQHIIIDNKYIDSVFHVFNKQDYNEK